MSEFSRWSKAVEVQMKPSEPAMQVLPLSSLAPSALPSTRAEDGCSFCLLRCMASGRPRPLPTSPSLSPPPQEPLPFFRPAPSRRVPPPLPEDDFGLSLLQIYASYAYRRDLADAARGHLEHSAFRPLTDDEAKARQTLLGSAFAGGRQGCEGGELTGKVLGLQPADMRQASECLQSRA